MKISSGLGACRFLAAIWCTTWLMSCSSVPIYDATYLRASSNETLQMVERAETRERENASEALVMYQQVLSLATANKDFPHYRQRLSEELRAFQESKGQKTISRGAGLGIPEIYARQVVALTKAHQGMARIYILLKELTKAELEITEAIALIQKCEFCPYTQAQSLRDSNHILQNVYHAQGAIGKALVRKLSVDLLEDHLSSDGGVADFFSEKQVLYGEASLQQVAAVGKLFYGARQYQDQERAATVLAVAGGLMAANAGIQQGLAQHALAKSGGVMTPQVEQMQINAQLAQMQSQLFMTMVAAQAGANPTALQVNTTPWAIPTFTQQLVDPKQGANTPAIMKGFATSAAQAGGASYQAGAQQVSQQVDALMPYRQSGKVDGATAQVEQFAEIFNAFLMQVQEMKVTK